MAHRPLYKKTSGKPLKYLVLTLVVTAALFFAWRKWVVFNPLQIVEDSVLRGKTFENTAKGIIGTDSQIMAYWFEDKTNPIISLSFRFRNAGYASDDENSQGIANLTAELLTEGAGNLTGEQLKEELADKAIGISFEAGKDDFSGSLLTTRENLPRAKELLKLILTEPRFEESDIQRAKNKLLEALRRQKEQPENLLQLAFNKELYGSYPYGRNPLGDEKTVAKITAKQLRQFVKDNFSRQNLIIGVAGDIRARETVALIDEVFGSLPRSSQLNFVREAEPNFDGRSKEINHPSGQNVVLKAGLGTARTAEDFYPLFVANYIIGGSGLRSRLNQTIREKRGLTYGVYSYLGMDDKSPLIVAGYSTTPDNYAEAEALFEEEWQKMGEKGISAAELEQAKNYLTASYNLRFASISNIADILAAMQKYDLGLDFLQKRNDYVQGVSLEQVNEAAAKYFNKDRLVNVSIGAFKD